jgi:hypothetical protein
MTAPLRRTSLRFSQREVLWGTRAPGSAAHSRGRSERARKARSHGDFDLEPDRLTQALRVASLSTTTDGDLGGEPFDLLPRTRYPPCPTASTRLGGCGRGLVVDDVVVVV